MLLEADLTYLDGRFRSGVQIDVDADGRVGRVGALGARPDRRLSDVALLPGMVNAHSHAFQRGLRGRGETFRAGAGSFWSWREAMYDLVGSMDADRIYDLSHRVFREMLAAGITTVGEFHYLHHAADANDFAFDEIVLRAASDAGIRIALLQAFYHTGDVGRPLAGAQERFRVDSVEAYWTQMDRLADGIASGTQSLGVVAHSIRAADIEDVGKLHAEAERRGLVFHMHVEEQVREIETCVAHYGRTPLGLLVERLAVNERFTAVHCTHTAPSDMTAFLDAGGTVCLCPLTEANLADGLADVPHIRKHGGRVCIGTDSNARVSMLEEMRWLEYGQRLRAGERGVCVDDQGRCAAALWEMATVNGARSLGVAAGEIAVGCYADLVAVDLRGADIAGWTNETLLASVVLGGGNAAVAGVCVGGEWRIAPA